MMHFPCSRRGGENVVGRATNTVYWNYGLNIWHLYFEGNWMTEVLDLYNSCHKCLALHCEHHAASQDHTFPSNPLRISWNTFLPRSVVSTLCWDVECILLLLLPIQRFVSPFLVSVLHSIFTSSLMDAKGNQKRHEYLLSSPSLLWTVTKSFFSHIFQESILIFFCQSQSKTGEIFQINSLFWDSQ